MHSTRALAFVALVLSLVPTTGCKRLLRGKYVTVKPEAKATVTRAPGKPRTYAVKVDVKTEPEARVRAFFDGDRAHEATATASKSGEASVSLEWQAGSSLERKIDVWVEKKEPDRYGIVGGDEKTGSAELKVTEPWGFQSDGSRSAGCYGAPPACSLSIDAAGTGLRVSAPKGTKIAWAGKQVASTGADDLPLPKKDFDKLASHAFDAKPFRLETTATLTFAGGEVGTAAFVFGTADVKSAVMKKLWDARKGPVAVPGDDAAPAKPRVLVVAFTSGSGYGTYGRPTRFSDYDLVAYEDTKRRTRTCGPYTGQKTGKTATFDLHHEDVEVTVHDRRTGAVKGTRTFRAPDLSCPSSFTGVGSTYNDSRVERKDIEAWLGSFVQSP